MRNVFEQQIHRLVCLVVLVVGISGCQLWPIMSDDDGRKLRDIGKVDQVMHPYAPHPVHLSEHYGHAFHAARDNQILNPQASENLDLVIGKDGMATYKSIELYRKSYSSPPFGSNSSSGGKK
ncbi:MAG: hypothetical protein NPIRA02_28710 [Nitrospirales bacterium]|nr:MAG: hypothetical protein NPIRA02_28710 [Nitrospirales bacterium]